MWCCELPTRRFLLILLAVCIAACKPAPKPAATKSGAAGPQIAATVVSIRATAEPGNKVTTHELLIANGRARSTREQDVWRLFDTKAGTVTTVDDIEKTIRVDQLQALLQRRRATLAAAIPAHYPRATLTRGQRKPILGANAQQTVIKVGTYQRELWIADHPSIPDELFAMMLASDAPSTPLAPIVRRVDEELLRVRGFPLADRAELPYGDAKMVSERTVTGIAPRQVPEAMLAVPRGYRDLTPRPATAKAD